MKLTLWGKIVTVCSFLLVLVTTGESAPAVKMDIVERWSPMIYQQNTDDSVTARINAFTRVNYDGDWRISNNWVNLPFYDPKPAIYYSLVESETHYYTGYYAYYPRHLGSELHEHDMPGILMSISKQTQSVDMLLVYSQGDWHSYSGTALQFEAGHPLLSVSSGGHEIKMIGYKEQIPVSVFGNSLLTKGESMSTSLRNKRAWSYLDYKLVSIDELWQRRQLLTVGDVFSHEGIFADNTKYFKKILPWLWQKHAINWLAQPAELIESFQKSGASPIKYLYNPYMI